LLTNGYGVFIKDNWSFSGFFTAYFTIAFFLTIYLGWKILKCTPFIKAEDMDFKTGLAEVEAHEAFLVVQKPMMRYDRFMDWLW
jgi:amino acid transporter